MDPDGLSILIATASTFARLRRLIARRSVRKRTGAAAERASLVFPTGWPALRGICVCVRIFCLRLSSHFCTGSLVDASVPGGAGRAGRAAVQPWPGEGPHKGEKRLHGRLYAGCAAGRSREAGVQGAGALGPVRRNRGGCALFRGRRGGARSDRRKPEEDDHQHLRAGRRDGRRRDDPPYRDRKRGGKHARPPTRYAFLWSTDFRASRYTASHWTTLSAFCM